MVKGVIIFNSAKKEFDFITIFKDVNVSNISGGESYENLSECISKVDYYNTLLKSGEIKVLQCKNCGNWFIRSKAEHNCTHCHICTELLFHRR